MLDASDCASLETIVDYGLETVDPERTATVPLRDLLYIFQTLGELVRFFHNDMHYPDLEAVEKFIGTKQNGVLHLICERYYEKMRNMLPPDIEAAFDKGIFDCPQSPEYYKARE